MFSRCEDIGDIGGGGYGDARRRRLTIDLGKLRQGAASNAERAGYLDWTDTAAGQAEPSVNPAGEEVRAQESIGSHATLRMADQPEGSDAISTEPLDHHIDDVLQVLIISFGCPHASRLGCGRRRSGDHQAVLVAEVVRREVAVLPRSQGPATVQTEEKDEVLVGPERIWVVEKDRTPGIRIDDRLAPHTAPLTTMHPAAVTIGRLAVDHLWAQTRGRFVPPSGQLDTECGRWSRFQRG